MSLEAPVIGFLVAAGPEIGGGHLMRCLSVARALGELGAKAHFYAQPMPGPLAARCAALGIRIETPYPMQPDEVDACAFRAQVDVLVIDGYEFDESWRQRLQRPHRPLVVMDDLNDPPVVTARAIINSLPGAERLDYECSSPQAELWLGPEFAPLGPEFAQPHNMSAVLRKGLLISFGASDPAGYTLPVLEALLETLPESPPMPVRVVTGPAMESCQVSQVQSLIAAQGGFEHHHDCRDMRELMLHSGLAISALGGTLYELAACGVPTVAVAVSRNQTMLAEALADQAQWCRVVDATPGNAGLIVSQAWACWRDQPWRLSAIAAASHWVDGHGSKRLAKKIFALAEQET